MTMDNSMEMRRAKEDHIVSLREKICYGLGDSACNVVYGLCSTLLTFFYTDYVGISAAVVGIIFLITRVFDGVSDIIMGFITDRTKSKYGKARPWILWMAVCGHVCGTVLCSGKCLGDGAGNLYFRYL